MLDIERKRSTELPCADDGPRERSSRLVYRGWRILPQIAWNASSSSERVFPAGTNTRMLAFSASNSRRHLPRWYIANCRPEGTNGKTALLARRFFHANSSVISPGLPSAALINHLRCAGCVSQIQRRFHGFEPAYPRSGGRSVHSNPAYYWCSIFDCDHLQCRIRTA